MRKLQENLLIRLAAWVLFLVAVWGCAVLTTVYRRIREDFPECWMTT